MKTVVIDAGHGGKDPGNLGTGRYKAKEKDVSLDIALRVGGYINTEFPEIKVVYTRSTDVFIGLDERAEIANKAKADLFISIHCNAFKNPESNGVETYVLGLHRSQENLEVAMKENSAIYLEDDYKTKYEGFDPNSPESIIALTIMQSAFLQQSLTISSYIQNQFKNRVGRKDRGVKQAGFLVLRKTTMPAILIELGFLTNAAEEDFLNSENGKSYMSSAIFRGFKEYKDMVEDPLPEGSSVTPKPEVKAEAAPTKSEGDQVRKSELEAQKQASLKAKNDSIQKALDQAKVKAVADSLEREKQRLIAEKAKREADIKKAEDDKKALLKAQADSLELVKQQKIADMKKREDELAAQRAKESDKKKAKEEADRKAKEEAALKELEAKQNAKEWLEEIKDVKEKELEEARRKAETDQEKKRLEDIKKQKEAELEEARRVADRDKDKERSDSLAVLRMIQEQVRIDSISKARAIQEQFQQEAADAQRQQMEKALADSLENIRRTKQAELASIREKQRLDSTEQANIKLEQARKDSLRQAQEAEAKRLARNKAEQDSIAEVRKAEANALAVTIDRQKANTAEEAELLFLQLRKKQLEQRIAELKGQNVETVTKKALEERASTKPAPVNKVEETVVPGLLLKVQVVTSAAPLSKTDPQFRGQSVWQYQQDGLYKYTVGSTQDFEEITKLQGQLRDLGFKGAFVVAFKDGERIKVSEAREMLSK